MHIENHNKTSNTNKATPDISIIIPIYNCESYLDQCLRPLTNLSERFEVILVDDASTDDSLAVAKKYNFQIYPLIHNIGPGPARNYGSKKAKGEILLFIDSDIIAHESMIYQLVKMLETNPDCAALFGSYDDQPAAPQWVSQYRNLLHYFVHQQAPEECSHFWAGFGAIRASAFNLIGGFASGYYGRKCEDIELGIRMRANQLQIKMDNSIQVTHLKRWTIVSMLKTDLILRGIPWTQLLLANRFLPDDFSLEKSHRISGFLASLLFISVIVGIWAPVFWWIALFSLIAFVYINRKFFIFLFIKHNFFFVCACLPLHILYYCNASLAFVAGITKFLLSDLSKGKS